MHSRRTSNLGVRAQTDAPDRNDATWREEEEGPPPPEEEEQREQLKDVFSGKSTGTLKQRIDALALSEGWLKSAIALPVLPFRQLLPLLENRRFAAFQGSTVEVKHWLLHRNTQGGRRARGI